MKNRTAAFGILAGIATGAVLGILFAPKRGLKLRKIFGKKRDDLIDAFNEYEESKHYTNFAGRAEKAHNPGL